MTDTAILENARKHLGIQNFNRIQLAMLHSRARDIILTAPTGSGKTLAFCTRTLSVLNDHPAPASVLVIAPSRELAIQIAGVVRGIAKGMKTVVLYGGHSMDDETKSLTPVPEIIIATPGRLLDHLQRGTISISSPKVLILDEYDKSLELGFESEMKRIIKRIGFPENIILTSATRLPEIPSWLRIKSPEYINEEPGDSDPQSRTEIIQVPSYIPDKLDTLCNLLRSLAHDAKIIVFVNHRESARRVADRLLKERIDAGIYHGELDQQQRAMALQLFENGTYPVLVTTDLAARGLDISGVTDIIHYHIPTTEQTWTHRNGRTARVDKTGRVYVITSEADSVPDFIEFGRRFDPPTADETSLKSKVGSLYFAAGKKEKISRGDILGFLVSNSSLTPEQIGKITVADHYSLAAIPRSELFNTFNSVKSLKIKGKKVKISTLQA